MIEAAIKAAKYSNVKRGRVSALAFSSSGEIIATSHNRKVLGQTDKFTEHAEEVLLHKLNRIKAFDRYKDITVMVIRVNKRGVTMAKPCPNCQKLLKKYPISVLYSDWSGTIRPL